MTPAITAVMAARSSQAVDTKSTGEAGTFRVGMMNGMLTPMKTRASTTRRAGAMLPPRSTQKPMAPNTMMNGTKNGTNSMLKSCTSRNTMGIAHAAHEASLCQLVGGGFSSFSSGAAVVGSSG